MKKLSIKDRAMAATSMTSASAVSSLSSPIAPIPKPKTGPGALVAFMDRESAVFQENKQIKEELKSWAGASPTKKIDPKLIVASRWANRHVDNYVGDIFEELKIEIANANGNIQPIKVRPLPNTDPQKYEIVFGHRRHRACLELGLVVLALVESVTDSALFEEMDRENRQRADLRPYEQGEMYRRALDENLYPSLRKLAESIGLQPGNVSTAVSIARLPETVLEAFPSRLDIQYRWALPLANVVEKNPDVVIDRAKEIASARKTGEDISAVQTFNRLTGGANIPKHIDERVINIGGKTIAKIKVVRNRYVVEFEKGALTVTHLDKLEAAIAALLI